ncbi:E3 ubiquitin-protein ligase E3D-like [Littorina saxatilis]|uniref:E3 ubiquitin-protein ligase E3D n=1 Tax=Littorina saxatilis TaxID=31220 RepID=A0AAN9BQK3_9CAEN
MAHKRCVRLHAEYKPMLSMLNVVLDLSSCFEDGSKSEAEPYFIDVEVNTITYRSATSHAVFHLEDLELFPATCRGLRWCSPSELHLSLQAKHTQGLCVSYENGIVTHVEEEPGLNNQDIVVEKIRHCQHRCYCAGCGRPVFTPKGVFKRVLPLPTENWSDFADIWFCHNHSHATPQVPQTQDAKTTSEPCASTSAVNHQPPTSLSPKPGDCLVSNLYLLVDSSQVCRTTVGITPQTQRLVCMRCGNFVGFVKKKVSDGSQEDGSGDGRDVYKIYLHAIKFLSPETSFSCNLDNTGLPFGEMAQNDCMSEGLLEDFLCQMFRDQSRLFTSFRFIVQSSLEDRSDCVPIVLLVWLLDQNLQVFSSECSVSAEPASETPQKEIQVTKVLKLLYKGSFLSNKETKRSQGSVFKMWERDNTVQGLDLPYPLCKQLLSLLITSTNQLPLSQRSLNSFHVGYLHFKQMASITG